MSRRHTRSAEETERLGEALAPALRIGDVILLEGPLGAGKTRFVTGLARGLACKARVRSPTFGLIHEYTGRVPLAHLDLYRLTPAEVGGLGIEELAERAALVVEWGEKLGPPWSADALLLSFTIELEGNGRRILGSACGERGAALLDAWRRAGDSSRAESAA